MIRPLALLAALIAAAIVPGNARAEAVQLSDGDSFRLGDIRYRLHGIDAPELHQDCDDAKGNKWPCGIRARSELRRLIGTHPLECKAITVDRFGRVVATCHAGGKDLAEEMVRSGYATIFTRSGFTSPYEAAQHEARNDKRGIWAGNFDVPSEWRRAHPRDEAPADNASARDWMSRLVAQATQWLQQKLGR